MFESTPRPPIMITPNIVAIILTQGKYALVRDDFAHYASRRWNAQYRNRMWYARRIEFQKDGKKHPVYLHRLIMEAILGRSLLPGEEVDHIDRNGLNDCPENLRLATHAENNHNVDIRSDNASGVKGVYWNKRAGKWHVRIRVHGAQKHLGYFDDIQDAAHAYDEAARYYFGEFAWTNTPGADFD